MTSTPVPHHPIFDLFHMDEVSHAEGFVREFPGLRRRQEFVSGTLADVTGFRSSDYAFPHMDEEYFEWIDVLEAVATAGDTFRMMELGAGYGRWIVRAAVALRQLKPAVQPELIAVEAEPTHFRWMREHLRDNGLDPDAHRLEEAAVEAESGEVSFTVGQADEWYGQAIVAPGTEGYDLITVRAITLSELLECVEELDLLDLDVQGAELRVLESAIDELDLKVKRVHVGTHNSEVEKGLRKLFKARRWSKINDYEFGKTQRTRYGEIEFVDGVQTWLNPRFEPARTSRWGRYLSAKRVGSSSSSGVPAKS